MSKVYERGVSAGWSFTRSAKSPGRARKLLREQLVEWGVGEGTREVAELLLSELVTNSIRHATRPTGRLVAVGAELAPGRLTFSSVVAGISLTSYRQSTCPPAMLGRVSAATRWINWGTLPLGGLAGGALAHAVGVRATLWVAAVGGCCSGLWLLFSPLRRMRDIPLGRAQLAA